MVKPEPDFRKRQKPDPNPIPTDKTRAGPEPDHLKPVTSLEMALSFHVYSKAAKTATM